MRIYIIFVFMITTPVAALNFASIAELSVKHLREHLGDTLEIKENANENNRQFLYFKMGDLNKDMQLDGIEVMKFLAHHKHEKNGDEVHNLELLEQATDKVINTLDKNYDGMISYSEYVVGIHHL